MTLFTATITGTVEGVRTYRQITLHDVRDIESAIVTCPDGTVLDRVHHSVWEARLGRWDAHVALVVAGSLSAQMPSNSALRHPARHQIGATL